MNVALSGIRFRSSPGPIRIIREKQTQLVAAQRQIEIQEARPPAAAGQLHLAHLLAVDRHRDQRRDAAAGVPEARSSSM